ncbi:AbrB/MazE/SpoVT family DNA-binding domain-containing protein [Vibrio harveyi]|uniref:AbrB/MazE/SpoVT family DNA-binding domain-containing protein n=2 Tax=Vibrio harveyi TaxID=669 RepID=UPI00057710E7|nr:hypothetical protein [Vibrio harveyi]MBY7699344.1 hypothetical protein [Vibrio harveyi]PNM62562.1 hypothetical protein AL540_005955 [Vibrio harveyi]UIL56479.1 hypothetical protein LXG94_02270 [Vibrio harveyi]SQA36259.1 putative addiction module antidote [Vibrio harveyi]
METKIRIIGTSKGVILSKDTLNTLEANLGDYIEINLDGNSVILTKSSKKDIKIRNEVKNQDLLSTFIGEFFKNDIYREHYINKREQKNNDPIRYHSLKSKVLLDNKLFRGRVWISAKPRSNSFALQPTACWKIIDKHIEPLSYKKKRKRSAITYSIFIQKAWNLY